MIDNYSRASLDEKEQSKCLLVKGKRRSQSRRKLKLSQKYYDPKNSQGSSSLYFSNLRSPNSVNEIDVFGGKG